MCLVASGVLAFASMTAPATAQDQDPDVKQVYIVTQEEKVTLPPKAVGRINANVQAGGKMSVKVTKGKANLKKARVTQLFEGRPAVGADVMEIEVTPAGKGEIEVSVTLEGFPGSGPPSVEKYKIVAE